MTPSGNLDGTNVPKKKVFSSIAKTVELIIGAIAFKPTIMATFAAVFEAIVENGET